MFVQSSYFFVAVVAAIAPKVEALTATLTMSCPDRLVENTPAEVICMINTTAVASANCAANVVAVTFTQSLVGKPVGSACATSYTKTNCSASKIPSDYCECTEQVDGVKTFKYNFVALKDKYEGAEFICSVCAAKPPLTIEQNNCKSLTFKVNSELTTPVARPADNDSKDEGLTGGEIAGIVLGSVGGVLIVTGIIIFAQSKRAREYVRANT